LDALEPAAGRDRRPLVAAAEPDEVWALVAPADAPAVLDAARAAAGSDGTARVLLGTETELTELHRSMPVLRRTLTALPAGTVRDLGADGARSPGAAPSLEPLLSYRRADLVPAVAAYLRHRGPWERAAADLGVHRNTPRAPRAPRACAPAARGAAPPPASAGTATPRATASPPRPGCSAPTSATPTSRATCGSPCGPAAWPDHPPGPPGGHRPEGGTRHP